MANIASLSAIVNAVHSDPILTGFIPPGASSPVQVPGGIGESSKQAKQASPYVIWIPTRDRYAPMLPAQNASTGKYFPRLIRTRWMGVELHINCPPGQGPTDFDQVDVCVNAVIAAIHRALRGSYELTGGLYLPTKGTELTKSWKVYVLSLEIAVPITETTATAATATISTITDPLSMKFPNGHEVPAGGPAFPPP